MIVDVSHALGRQDIILPCARAALAAGADGLMIETHPSPDQALSDGFQQLDLDELADLISRPRAGRRRGQAGVARGARMEERR